jgi:hypothetical protein
LALLLCSPLISSCTFALDAERVQCRVTADCRDRGGEFAGSTCEDSFCVPAPAEREPDEGELDASSAESPMCERDSDCTGLEICHEQACVDAFACEVETVEQAARVTLPVVDVFGGPLPGTAARLCRNIDPECVTPLAEPVANENGMLTLDLPAVFQGYVEFVVDGYFPQLQILPRNPADGSVLQPASLLQTDFLVGLGLAVGAQPDPERGHVFLSLLDCYGPAANIEITSTRLDEGALTFYVLDGVPSADLTATTKDGSAGFLNLPSGNAAVELTHAETGQELAQVTLVVRAGFLTNARIQPEVQ